MPDLHLPPGQADQEDVRLGGRERAGPDRGIQALASVAGLRRGRTDAREKPPVRPVPDELVERVLSHLSPAVATMVRVQRLAGMRPQEIILMHGADIERSDPKC